MSNKHIKAIDASTLFYNLFFRERKHLSLPEYLENSFFDASGIIDLNKDKYTILNHIKNKYYLPLQDGSYSKIYEYMVNLNIHEDDIEMVKKVFDPKTILINLYNSNYPNFTFVHYRMKLTDGTYRWVEHAIISGEENGIERGIIRFYIYDIENVKSRELGFINDEKNSLNRQKDEITSLFTRETFFEQSYEYNENHDDLCMIAIDIEHFKLFDEWYGRDNGTILISDFGKILLDYVTNNGGIAGYFGQDDFAILAKLRLLAPVILIGFPVSLLPMWTCKSANISYIYFPLSQNKA